VLHTRCRATTSSATSRSARGSRSTAATARTCARCAANPERFTPVEWEGGGSQSFRVQIAVDSWDRRACSRTSRGRSPSTARTSSPTAAPSRTRWPGNWYVAEVGDVKALRGLLTRSATSTASSTPARVTPS
jgi:hypothetical protein